MLQLGKFSIGVGDRFARQARAQLRACQLMLEEGIEVIPVWNKSNREHALIGSEPSSVVAAARAAVEALAWSHPWHVDADHIRLETVDRFLAHADFFTIDVADTIGQPAAATHIEAFVGRHPELVGTLHVPGIDRPLTTTREDIARIAGRYLEATREAGVIYRYLVERKGEAAFIAEVSMDETDVPQTPPELLVILAALADEQIRLQTIAPKFSGRFNKGVDYVGDLARFEREFHDDLAVVAHARNTYGLPANLKLSIHSGSDKFSLYPVMRRQLAKFRAGIHLKTAGTTWLEELIGLSEAGGEGLALVQDVYDEALKRLDELCAPYAAVIDIRRDRLPTASEVRQWTGEELVAVLQHDPANPRFNSSVRQLLHVAFKLAALQGARYLGLLDRYESIIAGHVTDNLYRRHLRPLLVG